MKMGIFLDTFCKGQIIVRDCINPDLLITKFVLFTYGCVCLFLLLASVWRTRNKTKSSSLRGKGITRGRVKQGRTGLCVCCDSIGLPVELSSRFIRYSTLKTGKEQLVSIINNKQYYMYKTTNYLIEGSTLNSPIYGLLNYGHTCFTGR